MIAVIDIDTLLYNAALAAQENYVIVKHKLSNKEKEFKTQTEFFGHYAKRDGGWLATTNFDRESRDLPPFSPDEFEITQHVRLVGDGELPPVAIAKGRFRATMDWIQAQEWCSDFVICYGRGENFRYNEAQTQPYKANRSPKPLLLKDVSEYMQYKYKDHIVYGEGVESDDVYAKLIHEAWVRSGRDLDKVDSVGVVCDKDALQFPSIIFNFQKPEEGLKRITPLEAAMHLGKQHLCGDTCDTILGLPQIAPELASKYGIRKSKSIGETTAVNYLKGCATPKEVFERVVEAYKVYYGVEKKEFTSFRGEQTERNWLDHLNEQFQLLRMRTTDKPNSHVSEFLKRLEVNLEEEKSPEN